MTRPVHLERDGYVLSTARRRLDVGFVCSQLNRTYWAARRPRETIEASIRHSVCFGIYQRGGGQVGFARVVTDHATHAWLCDVVIDEGHRGRGLGTWLMACITRHPDVRGSVCLLGTRDAHGLYEKFGFVRAEMMRRVPA